MNIINRTISVFLTLSLVLSPIQGIWAETSQGNKSENSSFSKLHVSPQWGQVVSRFNGKAPLSVILLQDIHCHSEAQLSIAHLLKDFARDFKEQLKSIYVEGASGPLDFSFFKDFPDPEIKKDLALYYLKTGRISGAEYFALTEENPLEIVGADNLNLYFEDLNWFQEVLKNREQADLISKRFEEAFLLLESKVLNPGLSNFLKVQEDYDLGHLSLQSYLTQLENFSKKASISLQKFKNIQHLLNIFSKQNKINEKLLQNEIAKVQSELLQISSSEEKKQFITKTLSFKLGKISSVDYFLDLSKRMREKKMDLSSFPNFQIYLEQSNVLRKINQDVLTQEFKKVFVVLSQTLARTEDEKEILKDREILRFLKSFYYLELSRSEFISLRHSENAFSFLSLGSSLKNIFTKNSLKTPNFLDQPFLNASSSEIKKFYTIALKRDGALTKSVLEAVTHDTKSQQVAVLITGGFHTKGIARQLKARDISYVIVQPRVEHVEMKTPYLAMMKGEKSPLENVMENELNSISNQMNLFKTSPGMLSVMGRYQAVAPLESAAQSPELVDPRSRSLCAEKLKDVSLRERIDLFFLRILTTLKIWFGKISNVQRVENWLEERARERGLNYEDLTVEKIGSQLFVQVVTSENTYGFILDEKVMVPADLNLFDQNLLEEAEFLKRKENALLENPPLISRFLRTISEYRLNFWRGASLRARAFALTTAMAIGLTATGVMAQQHVVNRLPPVIRIDQGYHLTQSFPADRWPASPDDQEVVLAIRTRPHQEGRVYHEYIIPSGQTECWLTQSEGDQYLQVTFLERSSPDAPATLLSSGWSNLYRIPRGVHVLAAPLAAPTGFAFDAPTRTLSWDRPAESIDGYEVRRFQGGEWVIERTVPVLVSGRPAFQIPFPTSTSPQMQSVQVLAYRGYDPVESRVRGPSSQYELSSVYPLVGMTPGSVNTIPGGSTITAAEGPTGPPARPNLTYHQNTDTLILDSVEPGVRYELFYNTQEGNAQHGGPWIPLGTHYPSAGERSISIPLEQGGNIYQVRVIAIRGQVPHELRSAPEILDIDRAEHIPHQTGSSGQIGRITWNPTGLILDLEPQSGVTAYRITTYDDHGLSHAYDDVDSPYNISLPNSYGHTRIKIVLVRGEAAQATTEELGEYRIGSDQMPETTFGAQASGVVSATLLSRESENLSWRPGLRDASASWYLPQVMAPWGRRLQLDAAYQAYHFTVNGERRTFDWGFATLGWYYVFSLANQNRSTHFTWNISPSISGLYTPERQWGWAAAIPFSALFTTRLGQRWNIELGASGQARRVQMGEVPIDFNTRSDDVVRGRTIPGVVYRWNNLYSALSGRGVARLLITLAGSTSIGAGMSIEGEYANPSSFAALTEFYFRSGIFNFTGAYGAYSSPYLLHPGIYSPEGSRVWRGAMFFQPISRFRLAAAVEHQTADGQINIVADVRWRVAPWLSIYTDFYYWNGRAQVATRPDGNVDVTRSYDVGPQDVRGSIGLVFGAGQPSSIVDGMAGRFQKTAVTMGSSSIPIYPKAQDLPQAGPKVFVGLKASQAVDHSA